MRKISFVLSSLLLSVASCALSGAQEVAVSVGSVTKYSGIATNRSDVRDIKSINVYLNTLESQLAKAFINHPEVNYLDRMNTGAIFHELNLSSDTTNFDASSGAMRGLLGRLDFIVVIDSSTPATARIRLLDVQSGAVKAIETCARTAGTPRCVAPFVGHALAAMQAQKINKEQLASQQAQAAQQMASIKPDLDDALARLSAENDFWQDLSQQLASAGQSLRPAINSALRLANTDADTCKQLYNAGTAYELPNCLARLNNDLGKLDKFKN